MKVLLILCLSFVLINYKIYSQEDINYYKHFCEDLIKEKKGLAEYFSRQEIDKANRLEIGYTDVEYKLLISYDIEKEIKDNIAKNNLPYDIFVNNINDSITCVNFSLAVNNYLKSFYFLNGKLISPLTYFCSDWKESESKYFEFYVSDTLYFNKFCKTYLDNFVDSVLKTLEVSDFDRRSLSKEKILYYMCRDENEIEKVTGFKTKGLYVLSTDAIVTTYNCHFHEVAHLLMNYKLKSLPLFTLPFMQEGFAVAMGGRGGLSSNVLMNIGSFIIKSDFIDYNSILTKSDFQSEDPSITYPACGWYNKVLMSKYGINEYLKFYKQLSGNSEFVSGLDTNKIKSSISFQALTPFRKDYTPAEGIYFNINEKTGSNIYKGRAGEIYETKNFYRFKIKNPILISENSLIENYVSKKYEEVFPGRKYNGETYLLTVSPKEVKLYNLYSNDLIVSYDEGFSLERKKLVNNSLYEFYIKKNIFKEGLLTMKIEE